MKKTQHIQHELQKLYCRNRLDECFQRRYNKYVYEALSIADEIKFIQNIICC